MKRAIMAIAAAAALAGAAYAQDSTITVDEDALFGEEAADTVEAVPQGKAESAVAAFLKTEAVRIGGSFSGSVGADWTMDTPWTDPSLDAYGLSTTVAGDLFFDARPNEDFRVYGKVKASYPFSTTESFLSSATYVPDDILIPGDDAHVATGSGSITTPNLNVFELFADWNYKDKLFFRFGKHTVKWGVGYFFSPADIINVGAIDPLNPDAQREGPVSLRINYPVLGTQTNLWAYAVMPRGDDPKPEDIAGAAKLEFLVAKSWELGLGGYYKYDHPPRAMITASGSFWKLNLFGEAVGAWGSDKSFVTDVDAMTPGFFTSEKREDQPFFSATAGFSYSSSEDHWSIAAQYLYSGEGYADDEREALIDDARANQGAIEAALIAMGSSISFSDVIKGLILNSGRNYAALSLSKSELFCEDLSVGALVWANLSDFSGFARPYVSWKLFDKTSLEFSSTFVFGSSDSEYVVLNDGPALTLGLKASLGSGNF
jgi:hypothetical protein